MFRLSFYQRHIYISAINSETLSALLEAEQIHFPVSDQARLCLRPKISDACETTTIMQSLSFSIHALTGSLDFIFVEHFLLFAPHYGPISMGRIIWNSTFCPLCIIWKWVFIKTIDWDNSKSMSSKHNTRGRREAADNSPG